MSTTAIMLELQKQKTSHILHLILTILTGVWAIVWIICAVNTCSNNREIDRKIQRVLVEEGRHGVRS